MDQIIDQKNHNSIINPFNWKINTILTALWYWNQSLKQIGNWTFLMILNFHLQKHWSMTPHIHVKKIIYNTLQKCYF